MSKSYSFELHHEEETRQFAKRLAQYLSPSTVITLAGDLGAGKTTFTQGLAKGLGITQIVNSPTFTIIKEYKGKMPLYHMDVYRLEGEVDDLGFDEYFYGDGVSVIEWPSIIEEFLPETFLHIDLNVIDQQRRMLTLKPTGEKYTRLCEEFIQNEDISN